MVNDNSQENGTRLWVHRPGQPPTSVSLVPGRTVVGRADDADVHVEEDTVSWHHVELNRTGSIVVATDLGSRNGTLHNGRPLSGAARLRNGDVLVVGKTRIEVALPRAEAYRSTIIDARTPPALSEEQRTLLRALAAPFREPGAFAPRPPTRAELAAQLHMSERTVQRRMDDLARALDLPEHRGNDRARLLAQRAIELGLHV